MEVRTVCTTLHSAPWADLQGPLPSPSPGNTSSSWRRAIFHSFLHTRILQKCDCLVNVWKRKEGKRGEGEESSPMSGVNSFPSTLRSTPETGKTLAQVGPMPLPPDSSVPAESPQGANPMKGLTTMCVCTTEKPGATGTARGQP